MFCTFTSVFSRLCAVPNIAVLCSSLMSCFPRMLLRYFVNDFETLPVASIANCITSVFTFHKYFISLVTSQYFIFSSPFLLTFLSPEIVVLLRYVSFYCHGFWCPFYCDSWFCKFIIIITIVIIIIIIIRVFTVCTINSKEYNPFWWSRSCSVRHVISWRLCKTKEHNNECVFINLYSADFSVLAAALLPYVHILNRSIIFSTSKTKTLTSERIDPNEK